MPIVINYRCEFCNRTMMWLYDEEDGLFPDRMRGCLGEGCTNVHHLSAVKIDDQEAEDFRSKHRTIVESSEE